MSSRSTHNIGIVFTTQGAATVLGTLNRMNYGMSQLGQTGRRSAHDLGLFDRQLQAIGTTLRYAFAGMVVYGISNVTDALKDLEDQISTLSAVSDAMKLPDVRELQRNLQDIAIQTGIPRATLVDAAVAALSGLPSPRASSPAERARLERERAARLTEVTGPGAIALQSTPEAATRGIIGLGASYDLDITKGTVAAQIAGQLIRLQHESVIGTGEEITRYVSQYGSEGRGAGLNLSEFLALAEIGARPGGSFPSVMRWQNQFLMNIKRNQGKREENWAAIGLPFDVRMGMFKEGRGIEVIDRMMREMRNRGVQVDPNVMKSLTDEQVAAAFDTAQTDPKAAASMLGITKGGATFFDFFGRQESSMFALRLMADWFGPQGIGATIQKYNPQKAVRDFRREVEALEEIRTFHQLSESVGSFRDNLILAIEDGIRPMFKELTKLFDWAKDHPVLGALGAGGAAVAGFGFAAILKRILGRRGMRIPGPGGVGTALGIANIGGEAPTGTPLNPFFVVVMNPGAGMPFGRGPGPIDPTTGKPTGRGGRLGRLGGLARGGLTALTAIPLAALAWEQLTGEPSDLWDTSNVAESPMRPELALLWHSNPKIVEQWQKGNKEPWNAIVDANVRAHNKRRLANMTPEQREAFKRSTSGKNTDVFDKVATAITKQTTKISGVVGGKETTETIVRLEASEELRRLIKARVVGQTERTHVPAAGWTGGAIPTSRGRSHQTIRNAT
jgi:hypothetical protein